MAGFDNDTVYGTGLDLSGNATVANKLNVDGYVYWGNSAGNPQAGVPTSVNDTIGFIGGNGSGRFENRRWLTAFVVDPSASEGSRGTYQTLTAAMAAASAGTVIYMRPGTYTEDVTWVNGVLVTALPGSDSKVTLVGKITFNVAASGVGSISNINLRTNGDYLLDFGGSNTNFFSVMNCLVQANDNDAVSYTNSGASSILTFQRCRMDPSATYRMFAASPTGFLVIRYCHNPNGGGSTVASTISSGTLRIDYSELRWAITTSGTSSIEGTHNFHRTNTSNQTALTVGGSGTNFIVNSYLTTGTASAISVGATCTVADCVVNSTNTNPITGAGTLNLSNIDYTGSGIETNVTTQVGFYSDLGKYRARQQPCFNAYLGSTQNNVTGDGTQYDWAFGIERFDLNSNFNTGTGVFTAPVTGKYLLCCAVRLQGLTGSMTRITLQIVTSNWTYECESISDAARDANNLLAIQGSVIADMDASDTALVRVVAANGTLVADAGGNGTLSISGFQGLLVS